MALDTFLDIRMVAVSKMGHFRILAQVMWARGCGAEFRGPVIFSLRHKEKCSILAACINRS